jgi:penicillin-binding protein 2
MHRAIAQSCDTYFYAVSDQIGIDRLHDFLVDFGFSGKVGIDILGERSGLVPSRAWKKKAFKKKELQVWFPGETVIAGIGQGFMLVTPLQLAHATATMAMRGEQYQPRLVRAVRDSSTGKVVELPPRRLPDVVIKDPKAWDAAIDGMIGVMQPGGTAYRSQIGAKYQIAGKTGTAQVFSIGQNERYNEAQVAERLRDHGLFIAFAPAEAPKIAVAVVIENGRHGTAAAAIARKVLDAYLAPETLEANPATAAPTPAPIGGSEE